jgi:ferritin-like metal-binding protein YciE
MSLMDTPALLSNDLLTIYLNDHLAGATAGSDLAARAAAENEGNEFGEPLAQLAAEIAQDREELLGIINSLGRQIDHVKLAVGWTAEKLARLKPNGRVFGYSPLSRLLELEGLASGIHGKRALWAALEEAADLYTALDPSRLRALGARADRQLDVVDRLHRRAARLALGSGQGSADSGAAAVSQNGATSRMREPRELLLHELGDILYAETMLVKALPTMANESTDPELKAGFEQHLEETREHVETVKQAFEALGEPARAEQCPAIDGIKEEHDEFINAEQPAPNVRDIFLTGSGSRAEHYEIAAYTGLISMARGLGERECARLLSKNLKEEQAALASLTAVGKRLVGTS